MNSPLAAGALGLTAAVVDRGLESLENENRSEG